MSTVTAPSDLSRGVGTNGFIAQSTTDSDELYAIGYKPALHRTFGQLESFCASFCAMNFMGVTRTLLYVGLACGGPAAMFTSSIVTIVGVTVTAAVLAEICSALPINGSIYVWASEAAGRKWGRLVGFVVGWWACTAWISFTAVNSQSPAIYLLSLMRVWDFEFDGGLTSESQHYRSVLFAVSLGCLWLAIALNYLPPRFFRWTFRLTIILLYIDLLLVHRTYGFRSADQVFRATNNDTGFSFGWAWCLSFFYAGQSPCGYDAAGHVSEETKRASVTSARGIFWSGLSTAVMAALATIVWLFCLPPPEMMASFDAPQPFVQIYGAALGPRGATTMTVIAVVGIIMSTSCAIVASSRLVFAIARDGILPGSTWISKTSESGQPRNAVTVIAVVSTGLLLISIGSQVAFTSLLSAAATPSINAYALIALCRLFVTRGQFKNTRWSLGRLGPPCYLIAALWNLFLLSVLYSPLQYPFTGQTFNFSIVIMAGVSILGIGSWWLVPEENWLRPQLIEAMRKHAEVEDVKEKTSA